MSHTASGWSADCGGRLADVSGNLGYYQNMYGPQGSVLERWDWGTTAAPFPLAAGVMRISELEDRTNPHALGLAITNTCAKVGHAHAQAHPMAISPSRTAFPEVPLDPNLNLASLNLPNFR